MFSLQQITGEKTESLNNFKNKNIRVLTATDIASRCIDIESLSHVINFELPDVPETYIHCIGRTGRAGANGKAILFAEWKRSLYCKTFIN